MLVRTRLQAGLIRAGTRRVILQSAESGGFFPGRPASGVPAQVSCFGSHCLGGLQALPVTAQSDGHAAGIGRSQDGIHTIQTGRMERQ